MNNKTTLPLYALELREDGHVYGYTQEIPVKPVESWEGYSSVTPVHYFNEDHYKDALSEYNAAIDRLRAEASVRVEKNETLVELLIAELIGFGTGLIVDRIYEVSGYVMDVKPCEHYLKCIDPKNCLPDFSTCKNQTATIRPVVEQIKAGTILVAHDPCIMNTTKAPTLTIGKEYIVDWANDSCFLIIDDLEDQHIFSPYKKDDSYYGNFFHIKKYKT